MKKVNCLKCNGYYKLKEGKFGAFAGCSNYPQCKSTIKLNELFARFFVINGVNIYAWDKVCWKCDKKTKVYSYYLNYELDQVYDELYGANIGIGDVPYLDNILSNKYPTIRSAYSNTTKSNYMANNCEHCGALQGHNYVVDDPHEIMSDLIFDSNMGKYLIETLQIEITDELLQDIQAFVME